MRRIWLYVTVLGLIPLAAGAASGERSREAVSDRGDAVGRSAVVSEVGVVDSEPVMMLAGRPVHAYGNMFADTVITPVATGRRPHGMIELLDVNREYLEHLRRLVLSVRTSKRLISVSDRGDVNRPGETLPENIAGDLSPKQKAILDQIDEWLKLDGSILYQGKKIGVLVTEDGRPTRIDRCGRMSSRTSGNPSGDRPQRLRDRRSIPGIRRAHAVLAHFPLGL